MQNHKTICLSISSFINGNALVLDSMAITYVICHGNADSAE